MAKRWDLWHLWRRLSGALIRCAAPSLADFSLVFLENLGAFYISSEYRTAFPLILFMLVILFKPEGLFGRKEERTI